MHYGPVSTAAEVGLADLVLDDDCQQRARLDPDTVERYRDLMAGGVRLPPVKAVLTEGGEYLVWDGFHTLEAARLLGWQVVDCEAEPGTRRDAVYRSTGANAAHGLHRSPADLQRALYTLWDDPEWRAMSERQMAEHVGVSHTTVQKYHKRYLADRGLVPREQPPKGNPPPEVATVATARPAGPRDDSPGAESEPELGPDGDGWERTGSEETDAGRKARQHAEALGRAEGVLARLSPEAGDLLRDELALQERVRETVELLRDLWRHAGGRKRRGPYSRLVRRLVECPGLDEALACVDCDGSGRVGPERCPSCHGHGFHLGG